MIREPMGGPRRRGLRSPRSSRLQRSLGGGLALVGLLSACELAEVAAPPSADLLVVESVLRVGAPRQIVVLHRTVAEGTIRGEPGAKVEIHGPDGVVYPFQAADPQSCMRVADPEGEIGGLLLEASCYLSAPEAADFVHPGASYELHVTSARGEVLRGRTKVPGDFALRVPRLEGAPGEREIVCTLPTTPFRLTWTRAEGAWSYLIGLRLEGWGEELRRQGVEVPDPLELTGVSVTEADTTLLFPENLGLFQRGELDTRIFLELRGGLASETESTLVIIAADRNYTNALRGGPFNPSGSVRVPSVVGDGVGLFGSLVPRTIRSGVTGAGACPLPVG